MNLLEFPDWFDDTKHFFGKKCKLGHFIRYKAGNQGCVECARASAAKRQIDKADEYETYQRQYNLDNRAALSAASAERERRYKLDPKRAKRIDEVRYAATRNWQANNPGRLSANTAKRRAAKLQRTPPWADLAAIDEVYAECPDGMTVDHYYPLQGELVSGLHVHNNLQYLTLAENSAKLNRCTDEMLAWVIFK